LLGGAEACDPTAAVGSNGCTAPFNCAADCSYCLGCGATTQSNCVLNNTANGSSSGSCVGGYTGSCSYPCDSGTWGSPISNTCAVGTSCSEGWSACYGFTDVCDDSGIREYTYSDCSTIGEACFRNTDGTVCQTSFGCGYMSPVIICGLTVGSRIDGDTTCQSRTCSRHSVTYCDGWDCSGSCITFSDASDIPSCNYF
jgi:hypothetical protein